MLKKLPLLFLGTLLAVFMLLPFSQSASAYEYQNGILKHALDCADSAIKSGEFDIFVYEDCISTTSLDYDDNGTANRLTPAIVTQAVAYVQEADKECPTTSISAFRPNCLESEGVDEQDISAANRLDGLDAVGDPVLSVVPEKLEDNVLIIRLIQIFNVLSAGVGIIIALVIIISGIQYAASQGNPQTTAAVINRITNAVVGLLLYIFMWALLQWLVPGGVFNPVDSDPPDENKPTLQIETNLPNIG